MAETVKRCAWAGTTKPLMIEYHDKEWGRPVHDDRLLFEFLILEGAQAGLSWETILNKREDYRKAFNNFDARKIARYDKAKEKALLQNAGIVRNRLKIASAISNAQAFLAVQKEFGLVRQIYLAIRRRRAASQRPEIAERNPRAHAGIGRDEQRPEEARLSFRRHHHLLRLHAGRRNGERSHGRLQLCAGVESRRTCRAKDRGATFKPDCLNCGGSAVRIGGRCVAFCPSCSASVMETGRLSAARRRIGVFTFE